MMEKLFRSNFVISANKIVTNLLKTFSLTRLKLDQLVNYTAWQGISSNLLKCDLPALKQRTILLPAFTEIVPNPILSRRVSFGLPFVSFNQTRNVHMLVIRRAKMKKHKRRKFLKRMKFEILKKRQRRSYTREKTLQTSLLNQIKEAEDFNADQYVTGRIEKLLKLRELSLQNASCPDWKK